MKWTKASEQLPERDKPESLKGKVMRNIRTKIVIPDYEVHGYLPGMLLIEGRNDDIEILYIDIEWLDESPPASAVEEAARLYNPGTCSLLFDKKVAEAMQEAHITCARMYTGEIEKGREAIDILKALCALKKHKDTVGKDEYYEKAQPEVWKIANKFLEKYNL